MKTVYMFVLYAVFNTCSISTMDLMVSSIDKRMDIKKEYMQRLSQEVKLIIAKKVCWLRWYDEIMSLERYMPFTIGNKELSSIDLWKISTENRIKILEQNKKEFYTMNDHNELTNLLSAQQKQGLVLKRIALDDEVYNDCCGIPGGKKYYHYLTIPAIVVPISAAIGGGWWRTYLG